MKAPTDYAGLVERKARIERELRGDLNTPDWQERPNCSGWWLWREGGFRTFGTELLLLGADGREVASDEEYSAATGLVDENDGRTFNYWEGTETTFKMMPGLWFYLG